MQEREFRELAFEILIAAGEPLLKDYVIAFKRQDLSVQLDFLKNYYLFLDAGLYEQFITDLDNRDYPDTFARERLTKLITFVHGAQQLVTSMIRKGSPEVKREALGMMAIDHPDSLGRVMHRMLSSKKERVRKGAALLLSAFVQPSYADALAAALHDPDPDVQHLARKASLIYTTERERIVNALVSAQQVGDDETRQLIQKVVENIQSTPLPEELLRVVSSSSSSPSQSPLPSATSPTTAVSSSPSDIDSVLSTLESDVADAYRRAAFDPSYQNLRQLVRFFLDPDTRKVSSAKKAIRLLATLHPSLPEYLLTIYDEGTSDIRRSVLYALIDLADARFCARFIERYERDAEVDIREALAMGIRATATKELEPKIFRLFLEEPHVRVRVQLARALGKIRSERSIKPLSIMLAQHFDNRAIFIEIAMALLDIGTPDALTTLQAHLGQVSDPAMHAKLVRAIEQARANRQ